MLKVLTASPGETCDIPGITVGEAIELDIPLLGTGVEVDPHAPQERLWPMAVHYLISLPGRVS